MAKQTINIGASANDGTGDPLRNAFDKTNDNFNELYFALGGNSPTTIFDVNGRFDFRGKPHKISFYYETKNDLDQVDAGDHKGSIGFALDTAKLYYANGSEWIELANVSELGSGGGGSSANTFGTIAISGQGNIVADSTTDTLNLAAGANITLTANSSTDTITIAASGGGGSFANSDIDAHLNVSGAGANEVLQWSGSDYQWVALPSGGSSSNTFSTIAISGQQSVVADSTTDTLNLAAGSGITLTTNASNDTVTISSSTSANSSVIAPIAFARLAATTDGSGTNISWSGWNAGTGEMDFAFSTAQSDTNYIVMSDAETFDDYYVGITNKTVNGFRASFYDGSGVRAPSNAAPFALMVYGSTPTQNIVGSGSLTDLSVTTASASQGGALSYNSSSGVFTFTPADLSGATGGANTFGTIAVAGQNSVVADSLTDTLTLVAGSNVTLTTDQNNDSITIAASGGASLARTTQGVSQTVADGATENIQFNGLGISYLLYKVTVDEDCWVRIYSDTASRTADAGRPQGQDPAEGAGIVAEFVATGGGGTTFKITPGIHGWVDNSETAIPVAITNTSGSSATITTTLVGLPLES